MYDQMTADDYVDAFVEFLSNWYRREEKPNTADVEELAQAIRIFDENNNACTNYIATQTSRDYVNAFECYNLIRDLSFTEWDCHKHPTTIWDIARLALEEVFEYEDSEKIYLRCAEQILNGKEED